MNTMTNKGWAGFCDNIARWGVYDNAAPAVEQDGRLEVLYKPLGSIQVGNKAYIVPSNHYSASWIMNSSPEWTATVIAHNRATGAFETKMTRYVLDTSYQN